MSNELYRRQIQAIHQQMAILHRYIKQSSLSHLEQVAEVMEEIAAALGNLQLIYEEMQTNLETLAIFEQESTQLDRQAIDQWRHYYNFFQFSPDAYLITDANGLIIEANQAIATLLNVSQNYLIRRPLVVFISQSDRQAFRTKLNQLSGVSEVQNWAMNLCPKQGEPFVALLKIAIARNENGFIETLQIGVHDMDEYKQGITQSAEPLNQEDLQAQVTTPLTRLPQSLDGLQVLVVDDEADAREFITAVLESYGIRVTAVANAAAALKALEQSYPNVLISDIRMPDEDGYSLIRKVRELEAQTGWHIPAAALTAYLEEDREKAVAAGFESHLHKLAQPTELIEMITRLAFTGMKSREQESGKSPQS